MLKFLLFLLSLSCFAGEPLKIAIVDTGLNLSDHRFKQHLCPEGHYDFTNTSIEDTMGHGTHVAGLIQQYAGQGNYCFLIYKYYLKDNGGELNIRNTIDSFKAAIENGAEFINYSSGGEDPGKEERIVIENNPKVLFITAAGNDGRDLNKETWYPYSYNLPNIITVGAIDWKGSNIGDKLVWEIGKDILSTLPLNSCNGSKTCDIIHNGYMTGTSQATAIRTGKLVKQRLNK